ncbi:hypothetical protein Fmac_029320 [Flemingia macrophylla]|uniref:NAC domain-containing protein n=1 Tax=Flemingia macrophylla TaxID=520843 RepID=A0ABD1L9Z5_9FABA
MQFIKEFEARTYKIPCGFRFDPKDEILIGCYLWKKILSEPLPCNLISECDVFQTEPWKLQGGEKLLNWQKFFFYDPKERIFENSQKICAGNGQWREVKKGQQIEIYGKEVIAKKNTYVFWKGNDNKFTITNWVMNEFHLPMKSKPTKISSMGVYRIFKMEGKRGKKARVSQEEASTSGNNGEVINATPVVIDLTEECDNVAGTPLHASSIE